MKVSHAVTLLALGAGALALAGQVQAQAPKAEGKEPVHQEKKAAPRQTRAQREDALFAQLNLSADQQTQVQAVRQKYDLEPGKGQTRDEMRKVRMQRDEEISKILTPEQRAKWEQLNAKHAGAHRGAGAHRKAAGAAPAGVSGQAAPGGGGK